MTPQDIDLNVLSRGLGARYYRLALAEAARRNLSGAVLYARYAAALDPEHQNAVQLLRLCLYELGESGDMEKFPEESLGACGTLRNSYEETPDFTHFEAPLGVCKEDFCDKSQKSSVLGAKPHKLLEACGILRNSHEETPDFTHFEAPTELNIPQDSEECLEKIKSLGAEKKWREAAQAARALPQQSVRVLNIQGCLWALAGNRPKAVNCFAQALRKDRFNRLAAEGLAELPPKRRFLWGILGEIV
jgi:tetratricopeptide (TPR) repeat protein